MVAIHKHTGFAKSKIIEQQTWQCGKKQTLIPPLNTPYIQHKTCEINNLRRKNGILWNFGIDFQILIKYSYKKSKYFIEGIKLKLHLLHLEFKSVLKKEFLVLKWTFLIIQ